MKMKPESYVAEIINLTYLCQALHCLPKAGGLLDQPAEIVVGMKLVLEADNERLERERKRTSKK